MFGVDWRTVIATVLVLMFVLPFGMRLLRKAT